MHKASIMQEVMKMNTNTADAIEKIDEEIKNFPFEFVEGKKMLISGKPLEIETNIFVLKLLQIIKNTDEEIKVRAENIPDDISGDLPELLNEFAGLPENCANSEILRLRSILLKKRFLLLLPREIKDKTGNSWGRAREYIEIE